jgi:hypothetical protein
VAAMKLVVDVRLSPAELAEAFCDLDDEKQAQFFIEAARIIQTWSVVSRVTQAHAIGRHLRDCECSTYEARALVTEIADGVSS